MIFHKSTYADIQKYYPDNIVKFKETGDRLWRICSIMHHEIRCMDADGFEIFLDLNEPYEVDYPLPGRVVYQSGGNVGREHLISPLNELSKHLGILQSTCFTIKGKHDICFLGISCTLN